MNDALFDHHDENQEAEAIPEKEVTAEAPKVVETPAAEIAEMPVAAETVKTPVASETVEPSEEKTFESLLTELDSVKSDKWHSLLKFDTEGVKSAMEKEREVRDNLKKMNWW